MKKSAAAVTTEKKTTAAPAKKRSTSSGKAKTATKATGKAAAPAPATAQLALMKRLPNLPSKQQAKKVAILSLGAVLASALVLLLGWLLITVEFNIHFNDSQTITRRAFTIIEWATGKSEAAE